MTREDSIERFRQMMNRVNGVLSGNTSNDDTEAYEFIEQLVDTELKAIRKGLHPVEKAWAPDTRVMTPGGPGRVAYSTAASNFPGKVGSYAVVLDSTNPHSAFPRTIYPAREVRVFKDEDYVTQPPNESEGEAGQTP